MKSGKGKFLCRIYYIWAAESYDVIFLIASGPPDREELVFKILPDPNQLTEVFRELGRGIEIEIYPPAEGQGGILNL